VLLWFYPIYRRSFPSATIYIFSQADEEERKLSLLASSLALRLEENINSVIFEENFSKLSQPCRWSLISVIPHVEGSFLLRAKLERFSNATVHT